MQLSTLVLILGTLAIKGSLGSDWGWEPPIVKVIHKVVHIPKHVPIPKVITVPKIVPYPKTIAVPHPVHIPVKVPVYKTVSKLFIPLYLTLVFFTFFHLFSVSFFILQK